MEQVVLVCSLPASNGLAKQHAVAWFLTELLTVVRGVKKKRKEICFFIFTYLFIFCGRFIAGVLTKVCNFKSWFFRLIWLCSRFLPCVILDFVVFPCCRMNEDSVLWITGYGLQLHIYPGRDNLIFVLFERKELGGRDQGVLKNVCQSWVGSTRRQRIALNHHLGRYVCNLS